MEEYGIEPVKDFVPYATAFFAWIGSLNWLLILATAIAAFRAYVAWKEYKLKEKIESRKYNEEVCDASEPNTTSDQAQACAESAKSNSAQK